jgi:hypothetical protein
MSIRSAARASNARGSRGAAVTVLLPGLILLGACGQSGGGARLAPASSQCSATACTVAYPAVTRKGQASTGGMGTNVLGVATALIEINQGTAMLRIGTGAAVSLMQGKSVTRADLKAALTRLSSTEAVFGFSCVAACR